MTSHVTGGLVFPDDLDAWRRWQGSRQRLRRGLAVLRRRGRPAQAPVAHLLLPEDEPEVLVVVDVWSPSCQFAVGDPVRAMDARRTAVLTRVPGAVADLSAGRHDVVFTGLDQIPGSVSSMLTLGGNNELAGLVEPWARQHDARYLVVQHGLLTPWAPPLNDGAHLLAWSDADGAYWSAGRRSLTWESVGSQMFWSASQESAVTLADERPIMLGQLHGTELPRIDKQRVYTQFARQSGAEYRPHPNETDAISRVQHRMMRAAGVEFELSGGSINDLRRPVVSIFSTGTLEAAQRGLPAWVHHPNPPAWLKEFWSRYGLSPYRGSPTEPMPLPDLEPAVAIAKVIQS